MKNYIHVELYMCNSNDRHFHHQPSKITTRWLRMCCSDSDDASSSMSSEPESDSISVCGSSSCDDELPPAKVDLTLERLQSLHAHGHLSKKKLSGYAKKGMSGTRVKKLLERPVCECACKLPIKILFKICVCFWQLTKTTQDGLLWGLQHEAGCGKKTWHIQGQVSQKNIYDLYLNWYLCRILAMSGSMAEIPWYRQAPSGPMSANVPRERWQNIRWSWWKLILIHQRQYDFEYMV